MKINISLKHLFFFLDLESEIHQRMYKEGGHWFCKECNHKSSQKGHLYEHVEAKHISHGGYQCLYCEKVLKTQASLRMHRAKYHYSSN